MVAKESKRPAKGRDANREPVSPSTELLTRLLARSGVLTPEQAREAIEAGRISVGGRRVRSRMTFVGPDAVVKLDGRTLDLRPRTLVLAYHKPVGPVTTHRDEHGRETVYGRLLPRLPPELQSYRWDAVGRLDKDTSGLLLFTNDGAFLFHATSPQTHLPKRYRVLAAGHLEEAQLERLRQGVQLEDGMTRPARVKLLELQDRRTLLEIEITEGRHRQVRRMILALQSRVIELRRVAVGKLDLDLPEDAYRQLSEQEIADKLEYRRLS